MGRRDSKGLNYQDCEVLTPINKQSPDIAGGVSVDVGIGDQEITFEYRSVSEETR